MKYLRKFKQNISLFFLTGFLFSCTNTGNSAPNQLITANNVKVPIENSIKIALLLDTSGSMDGLLEQAKSQLWKIVNQLALAKKDDKNAIVEIAIYQYGNDALNSKEGYIENVLALTSDLDKISEKLFSLRTNGGQEYCGHVIRTAINQLDWNKSKEELNLIFIAGNEPFNQGKVDYKTSCKNAVENNITINTIFCGNVNEGISTFWQNGAILANGSYMNIDMNEKTVYIETPFDKEISFLNDSLNDTYLNYGRLGYSKKRNQKNQDYNSTNYGVANSVSRTISKSSHLYKNKSWDLVDAKKEKDFDINKIKSSTLPVEMQNMTPEEKLKYIELKSKKRIKIINKINALNKKRIAYIKKIESEHGEQNSLDNGMIKAIKKQAKAKGYTF